MVVKPNPWADDELSKEQRDWGEEKEDNSIWGKSRPSAWGEVGNESTKDWVEVLERPVNHEEQAQKKNDEHRAISRWNF